MTGSFGDLPKYPGEQPPPDRPPPRPEPPDSAADRLRHAFPTIVLLTTAAIGLILAGGLAVVVAAQTIRGGWLGPVLLAGIFLILPIVAVGSAVYQRAKTRRERGI